MTKPDERNPVAEKLAEIFRLPDATDISEDWVIDSFGSGGILSIKLVKLIDHDTVKYILTTLRTATGSDGSIA